jgi:hypothetical protein
MADPTPAALVDALQQRAKRRRRGSQWQILPTEQCEIEGIAGAINQARHQRLTNAFKPEGWITEY